MNQEKGYNKVPKHMLVYTTNDANIFKTLVGNRELKKGRIGLIKQSILDYGYISNPIIVNEKMEIIDGQGRCEALRQLGMPIEYRIVEGLGVNECRAMNLKPTSWGLDDYIHSYAEQGLKDYIELRTLRNVTGFSYQIIINLARGCVSRGGYDEIKKGNFSFTNTTMQNVMDTLNYLSDFKETKKLVGGRVDTFYSAIGWVYNRPGVDTKRLKETITSHYKMIMAPDSVEQMLQDISDCYNYKLAEKNRRYFLLEWRRRNIEEEEK